MVRATTAYGTATLRMGELEVGLRVTAPADHILGLTTVLRPREIGVTYGPLGLLSDKPWRSEGLDEAQLTDPRFRALARKINDWDRAGKIDAFIEAARSASR